MTKTERFELRLRPNIPAEAELLAELDALDGVYGGKTELLRECLRRGFTALNAAVEAQPSGATEEEVLDHLASVFPSGEYSYRIGKLFVDARAAIKNEKAADDPVGKVHPPVSVNSSTTESNSKTQEEQEAPASESASAPTQRDEDPEAEGTGEIKQRPNWSRFRGLAGSGDVKSGEK